MLTASQRPLSAHEYLALERQAVTRSEFFSGEMFAMARATFSHTLIRDNLAGEVREILKPGPCRVLTSNQRIKVQATGLYAYPDIVIVCAEPAFEDEHRDTLLNPYALVEVLSPTTENYDRGTKFRHYREIPSLEE
jgi:Uma2 family endonuclease